MNDGNSKPSAMGTAHANGVIGAGRVAYADAGAAWRYSITRLHRELPADEAARLDVSPQPSTMAIAVHGIVAGAYLASWSKRSDTIRWPLHAIAEAMGLDPVADSEGGKLEPGNGNRGKGLRRRIRNALDELEARGALRVVLTEERRTLYALVQLPDVPPTWTDPTYRVAGEGSPDVPAGDPGSGGSVAVPWSDDITATVEPGRVHDLGTYEVTWQRLEDDGPDDGAPSGPAAPAPEVSEEPGGSPVLPHGVAQSYPTGYRGATPRGSAALPLTEKNEKQDEQTDEKPRANARTAEPSVRPSVDEHEQQEQPRGGADGIPPGPERSAGNGGNGSGIPRAERQHVEALAAALPERVARSHPHSREHLAAAMLGHGAEQHRGTLDKLRRYLELGATAEVAGHLAAAAARWNGEARSLAGFVLTWLGDLPPEPRYRPEEYRYGFPLRDAMKTCGLAGDWGLLRASTFAMAAEAVLDGGHDPKRNADGFAAALAATVLQLVEPDEDETGEPSTAALARLAGDARPVPFVLPPEPPHEGPPRGVAALRMLGLGYPDARTSKPSGTERHRIPGMSGGVWR